MMLVFEVPVWTKPGKVLDMDDVNLPTVSEVIKAPTISAPFMGCPPLKVSQQACENWSAIIKLFRHDRDS